MGDRYPKTGVYSFDFEVVIKCCLNGRESERERVLTSLDAAWMNRVTCRFSPGICVSASYCARYIGIKIGRNTAFKKGGLGRRRVDAKGKVEYRQG